MSGNRATVGRWKATGEKAAGEKNGARPVQGRAPKIARVGGKGEGPSDYTAGRDDERIMQRSC